MDFKASQTSWQNIGEEVTIGRKRRTSRKQVAGRWKGVPESLNSHVLTPGNHEALHLTAPPWDLGRKAKSRVHWFRGTDVRVPKCWVGLPLYQSLIKSKERL